MEMVAGQQWELFPVVERKVKKRSYLHQLLEAGEIHGPLVTQSMVAKALELSTQRIHQLVNSGQLPTVDVCGHRLIPIACLDSFLTENRKTGRPVIRRLLQ